MKIYGILLSVPLCITSAFAHGQDAKSWLEENVVGHPFNIWLGPKVKYRPIYVGADEYKISFAPKVKVHVNNFEKSETPLFFHNRFGAGYKALELQDFYFAGAGYYRFGWKGKGDSEGIADRDGSLEASVVLGYANAYGFEAAIGTSWGLLGDLTGQTATLSAKQQIFSEESWNLQIDGTILWGDDEYMNGYYGINTNDAKVIGLPLYEASSGFRDALIGLEFGYQLNDRIHIGLRGEVDFILDGAKDSPLVENIGSDITYSGELGISYKF